MNEPEPTSTKEELAELRREMNDWAMGIRGVFVALISLPLYYCTKVLTLSPRIETIFEDMLGSMQKVPAGTLILNYNSYFVVFLLWLVAAAAVFLIYRLKKARQIWTVALVCMGGFVFSAQITFQLLLEPLIQVIGALSGGGEPL